MNKKKILWLTDIHLDHIDDPHHPENIPNFCKAVLAKNPDGIVITGDITSAPVISAHFQIMIREWKDVPVYFVLGNHDYYGGSFDGVDAIVKDTIKNASNFHYLTNEEVIELTPKTAIIGHNGWYDGQYSDWWRHGVVIMQDYFLITDFYPDTPDRAKEIHIFATMQRKARDCEYHVVNMLPKALDSYENVIFATHVPPFEEAAVYNGKKSDWRWMPNFSSKACGDALRRVCRQPEYQNKKITVLCGHTHGKAKCHPMNNITCYTGYSDYKYPLRSLVELEVE